MRYKYIVSQNMNPYQNLAYEQCLFDYVDENSAIIFLWQNENTIVIGKNQNVYAECKAEEFISSGGQIARRKSGGGAVYHDLGNLNFSILCRSEFLSKATYQKIISSALKLIGLQTEFNGRNDLLIDGRKFSGNAFYDNGRVCCQHGTVLVCSDLKKMSYYLTPAQSKLERHHIQSVASRVVNLASVSPSVTVEGIKAAIIQTTESDLADFCIDKEELGEKTAFFSSLSWVYGGMV